MPKISRGQWIREATQQLHDAGVDSPALSAQCLLCAVCGISRVELATWPEEALSDDARRRLEGLARRRAEGEPVAYLVGHREFFGRAFKVTPATLIPRPETELLVETALAEMTREEVCFADLGTGSGCIGVTLCAERPRWRGIAVDISPRALLVARSNAKRYGVQERIAWVHADFSRPVFRYGLLDLVVSNPPYVGKGEYKGLSPEVRDFEPIAALVPEYQSMAHQHHAPDGHEEAGEPEGLEHLCVVASEAFIALKPGGVLLMEHGWKQGEAIAVWLRSHSWEKVVVFKDLAGNDRLVRASKPEK